MSPLHDTEAFRLRLIATINQFQDNESLIRSQYQTPTISEILAAETAERDLLERATRRFLIDGILRALDWNPDDPTQVSEEARSWTPSGERLYFDYAGIAPEFRFPVVIIEAKAFDTPLPRRQRGIEVAELSMPAFLAKIIDSVKNTDATLRDTSDWGQWLGDLRTYVASLGEDGQSMLRRVVITAGRWLVVFEEPIATFVYAGSANSSHIHCFASLESILDRHADIFKLLRRNLLVDTLPVALDVGHALAMLNPNSIGDVYRAVIVVTTSSGASRRPYPTRSVYPAVVVSSRGRLFAITEFRTPEEEPRDSTAYSEFLARLCRSGVALEQRIVAGFGMAEFRPFSVEMFPGFPDGRARPRNLLEHRPSDPGLAEDLAQNPPGRRSLVIPAGDRNRNSTEYILVTGQSRFYKLAEPLGTKCAFHLWSNARASNVASPSPHVGHGTQSFTEDGQARHCSHEDLRSMRQGRCHVSVIESHLCCRSCVYQALCWEEETRQLPCPPNRPDRKSSVPGLRGGTRKARVRSRHSGSR